MSAGRPGWRVSWRIRLASWLVPVDRRATWREEWESELWHGSESGGMARAALVAAARGAWRDALATRREARRGSGISERTWGGRAMFSELRLAVRGLARTPGFTFLAVLTLALGIGANAALFTVVNSVLLRPLSYPDSEELVTIRHPVSGNATGTWQMSMHGFFLFEEENDVFESIGIYVPAAVNLASDAGPDRATAALVSASLFRTLSALPVAGRLLRAEDNAPGAVDVAVISHEFWQTRFGGGPDAVGSSIRIDGRTVEVVGIAERGLTLPRQSVDVWLPMTLDRASRPINSHFLTAIARLKDGVSLAAARSNALALTRRLPEALPTAYTEGFMREYGFTTEVVPLRDSVVGTASTALWIVFGGVGIVLLIACANVANLFLVRAEGRSREVAVRTALGAARGHLVRQFMAESVTLALAAGALGLVLAWGGVRALLTLAPSSIPRLAEVGLHVETVVFTAAIAIFTGLVFGILPLGHTTDARRIRALRDGGLRATTGRSRHRVRNALVVAQVALALVLLAGAGLMIRSFGELRSVEPGFDTEGGLTFAVSLPAVNYPDGRAANVFWDRLVTEIQGLPGVAGVGITNAMPLADGPPCSVFFIEERPLPAGTPPPCIDYVLVSPELFETLGIGIAEGRAFTRADVDPPTGVAIVNRALARQFWPNESALGRNVRSFGNEPPYYRIVGIVDDVRMRSLDRPALPAVYYTFLPLPEGAGWGGVRSATVVVRATGQRPEALTPALRDALARVDPEIPLARVRTVSSIVEDSLAQVTFTMMLLGIAGAVALLLGTIGLYGVVAYVVSERRSEIGIRMALGAGMPSVARMVLGHAVRLAVAGIVIGAFASLAAGRVLRSQLFGIRATDPLTLIGVAAILLAVSLLAAWLPARRAARVDPVETMRSA